MKLVVAREILEGERRVALVPSVVSSLVKKGCEVTVESSAGQGSFFSDEAYGQAGAQVVPDVTSALAQCSALLSVGRPSPSVLSALVEGGCVIGMLDPYGDLSFLDGLPSKKITVFSLERVPRISRAQSMDVLSSQANLAGYKAVVDAASVLPRAFPMMMTAAGTVPAAKVFVMGAGVAGLQAIATARRLGAVVSATDVRHAAGEQVRSLGAKFVFVSSLADAASSSGYAQALSEDDQERQRALVFEHIKTQDVVITTALIPGKPAPLLVTQEMVEQMRPGSVIVDLAVERGGNCALSRRGEVVDHGGVQIFGAWDLPSRLSGNASALYAKNIEKFLELLYSRDGFSPDWDDEIIAKTALMRAGEWVS